MPLDVCWVSEQYRNDESDKWALADAVQVLNCSNFLNSLSSKAQFSKVERKATNSLHSVLLRSHRTLHFTAYFWLKGQDQVNTEIHT